MFAPAYMDSGERAKPFERSYFSSHNSHPDCFFAAIWSDKKLAAHPGQTVYHAQVMAEFGVSGDDTRLIKNFMTLRNQARSPLRLLFATIH